MRFCPTGLVGSVDTDRFRFASPVLRATTTNQMAEGSTPYRYITSNSGVRAGLPIIEGTRIGVHDVIGLLQNGDMAENVAPRVSRAEGRRVEPSCVPMSVMIQFLTIGLRNFTVLLLLVANVRTAESEETLANGLVLPREWPPRLADFPTSVEKDPVKSILPI